MNRGAGTQALRSGPCRCGGCWDAPSQSAAPTASPEGAPWRIGPKPLPVGEVPPAGGGEGRRGPCRYGGCWDAPSQSAAPTAPPEGEPWRKTPSLSLWERCRPQAAERVAGPLRAVAGVGTRPLSQLRRQLPRRGRLGEKPQASPCGRGAARRRRRGSRLFQPVVTFQTN